MSFGIFDQLKSRIRGQKTTTNLCAFDHVAWFDRVILLSEWKPSVTGCEENLVSEHLLF